MNYKQIIIARKDLNMSPGKLAAQVAHGSIAWMRQELINSARVNYISAFDKTSVHAYVTFRCPLSDIDIYENWMRGAQTKVVCGARNKNQLLKAKKIAEELGMQEDKDFFLIYDLCRTELEEEEDRGTLTVIGFRPLPDCDANKISKHYQLY